MKLIARSRARSSNMKVLANTDDRAGVTAELNDLLVRLILIGDTYTYRIELTSDEARDIAARLIQCAQHVDDVAKHQAFESTYSELRTLIPALSYANSGDFIISDEAKAAVWALYVREGGAHMRTLKHIRTALLCSIIDANYILRAAKGGRELPTGEPHA